MRLVIVESPYAAPTPEGIERNVAYARAALADCLGRGEAPYASHLLYTQPGVLRDEVPEQRRLGIEAGLAWGRYAAATAVYVDLGISSGMREGVQRAATQSRSIEIRRLTMRQLEHALGPREAHAALARRGIVDEEITQWTRVRVAARCVACGGSGFAHGRPGIDPCPQCHGVGTRP